MTRYYVTHDEAWYIDAESEEAAVEIARDGGGMGWSTEWWAEEVTADDGVEIMGEAPHD